MKRILNPGRHEYCGQIFIKVTIEDGRLSISGVEGPLKNGDCRGGCGQIEMSMDEKYLDCLELSTGWTAAMFNQLLDIWRAWHLNDMRAGCEHQRAESWGSEKLEIITYRLTSAALTKTNRIKSGLEKRLYAGETVTPEELAIINLPLERLDDPDLIPGPAVGRYEIKEREEKLSTWIYEKDHPRGVLCKPCPICGYKFGSAWLKEELPAEVIEFLEKLPESKLIPDWI